MPPWTPVSRFDAFYGPDSNIMVFGFEPSSSSPAPLFLYTPGTTFFNANQAQSELAKAMARRGFLAAVAQKPEEMQYNPGTCAYFERKASIMFSPSSPTSVISFLCGRPSADCSQGIALAGFSQGAHLTTLALYFEPRITAALLIGNGIQMTGIWRDSWNGGALPERKWLTCLDNVNVSAVFPRWRRRFIVGEDDEFFGAPTYGAPLALAQHKALTGYDCGGSFDCIQPDGSGFYVVTGAEGQFPRMGGKAMHTFWILPGPAAYPDTFKYGSAPWCLEPSVEWLTATARVPRSLAISPAPGTPSPAPTTAPHDGGTPAPDTPSPAPTTAPDDRGTPAPGTPSPAPTTALDSGGDGTPGQNRTNASWSNSSRTSVAAWTAGNLTPAPTAPSIGGSSTSVVVSVLDAPSPVLTLLIGLTLWRWM